MKVAFLHGRSQAGRKRSEILHEWIEGLNSGLRRVTDLQVPESDILVPYYGDLLETVTANNLSSRGSVEPLLETQNAIAEELLADSKIVEDEVLMERGIRSSRYTIALAHFLDGTFVGPITLRVITRDVAFYLDFVQIRKIIHDHILEELGSEEPDVWIVHSLGSIVAHQMMAEGLLPSVKLLMTVGSPLGIHAVRNKLNADSLKRPDSVCNWINLYDTRDIVSLRPVDASSGWKDNAATNFQVSNLDGENPHSIKGYLGTAQAGELLKSYLSSD